MKDDDKKRDEIANTITSKDIEALGSPFLAEQRAQQQYVLPAVPGRNGVLMQPGAQQQPQLGGLSLEGYAQGGSVDTMRRGIDPYSEYGIRARYGRSF